MNSTTLYIGEVTMFALGVILRNESSMSAGIMLMWLGIAVNSA